MRIGFWGCLNQSGVGYVGKNLVEGLEIQHVAIVPNKHKGFRLDWVKGRDYTLLNIPVYTKEEVADWLGRTKPDVVLIVETPYTPHLGEECKKRGIKTVNVSMWEGADDRLLKNFDYHVAKFLWERKHLIEVMKYKVLDLVLPVEIHRFKFKKRMGKPKNWLHVAGYGGFWGRKNVELTIRAFARSNAYGLLFVKSQVEKSAYSQKFHAKSKSLLELAEELDDDRIVIQINNRKGENYELYSDEVDVSIQPSRVEGYGLNIIEPMMCGIPVITTGAPPMNCWSFKPYLVKCKYETIGKVRNDLVHGHNVHFGLRYATIKENVLVAKINEIADRDIKEDSEKARARMEAMSWEKLRDKWMKTLQKVVEEKI